MAIIVVGGSSKDSGKTSLVCGVIAALRDFGWTAVKITGHDYSPKLSASSAGPTFSGAVVREESAAGVWEELNADQATDTSRYLAAGARRALLVTRHGQEIPIHEIRAALAGDRNILFESNRIVDAITPDLRPDFRPDVCLALVHGASAEWKPSFMRLLDKADALVTLNGAAIEAERLPADIPHFDVQSLDRLPAEMVTWLRSRLNPQPPSA